MVLWSIRIQDFSTIRPWIEKVSTSVGGYLDGLTNLFLFRYLAFKFFTFGIAIIIMTIIVRLAMSPVTYKSYVSNQDEGAQARSG